MNGHSDVVGAEEDGTITFNTETNCYEENPSAEDFEHPSVDEEKERRAGFFDDDVDGNVEITFETKLQNMQRTLDEMISLNGRKGKSKFGYLNTKGRRSLKRLSKFLYEIGEQEWIK